MADNDEKGTHLMRTLDGDQKVTMISKDISYHVALRLNMPKAKPSLLGE